MVLFDWSNNTGTIYVKMDAAVVVEKSSFKMGGGGEGGRLFEDEGIDRYVASASLCYRYY